MKKYTFTAIVGSALAAMTIGLAAPAFAAPSGPNTEPNGTHQTTADPTNSYLDTGGQTPYGTYQNAHPRGGSR